MNRWATIGLKVFGVLCGIAGLLVVMGSVTFLVFSFSFSAKPHGAVEARWEEAEEMQATRAYLRQMRAESAVARNASVGRADDSLAVSVH